MTEEDSFLNEWGALYSKLQRADLPQPDMYLINYLLGEERPLSRFDRNPQVKMNLSAFATQTDLKSMPPPLTGGG